MDTEYIALQESFTKAMSTGTALSTLDAEVPMSASLNVGKSLRGSQYPAHCGLSTGQLAAGI